jgi:GT2 family glycosyltransferase
VEQDTIIGYVRGSEVSGAFLDSLMDLLGEDGYRTISGTLRVETGPALVAARNQLVKVFLEQTDATWLFMVDTDMVFEADVIERLRAVASPHIIAGALCFGWFADARIAKPTLYGEGMTQITEWAPGSLVPVYATGAACLLIHRRSLEAMPPGAWFKQDPYGAWGEDQGFFMVAADAGIRAVVDTSTQVLHDKHIRVGLRDYDPAALRKLFDKEQSE